MNNLTAFFSGGCWLQLCLSFQSLPTRVHPTQSKVSKSPGIWSYTHISKDVKL